jgi:enamine deaminase RidA (YjgF/YER057c/UK114 family)
MATLEKLSARGVYDPPGYSQAIKVTGAQTILFANVVKITTYVTDVRHRPEFRTLRDEFFGPRGPASTMVEVSKLAHPDYLIEIEAIAVV